MGAGLNFEGKTLVWTGRILSALPVLMLLLSGAMKLARQAPLLEAWQAHFGYPLDALVPIALAELGCAVLFAIPRTAALGALLMTGYLGGAAATHVRIGEGFGGPVIVGVLAWAGLYLRDARVRALLPLRRPGV